MFLASPADVLAEREIAEEVVGSINKVMRRFSWHIDLFTSGKITPTWDSEGRKHRSIRWLTSATYSLGSYGNDGDSQADGTPQDLRRSMNAQERFAKLAVVQKFGSYLRTLMPTN